MALIYSRAKKDAVDRAVAKAKAVKPFVKVLGYCEFEVEGLGEKYIVKFSKKNGEFVAECGCKANEYGSVCYHVVSCAGILKKQVADRAAEKAASLKICEGCQEPATNLIEYYGNQFCDKCIAQIDEMEAISCRLEAQAERRNEQILFGPW